MSLGNLLAILQDELGGGTPALLGALHELRRRGRTCTDVCWVGPVVPYARVGGSVSNVYFVYRRDLG